MPDISELVTIIVPTYNEKDNVAPLVKRVHEALCGYDYRLLFIDDNSKDGTAAAVRSLADRYPVDVIVRVDKRGLASAVVDGIRLAKGRIIGVIDADLQHPPEVLPRLVEAIKKGADVAIGSRYVRGGGCEGWGMARRVISKGAGLIAHLLLPQTRRIKDPMSGFFMLRRGVAEGADLQPTGYKILMELLIAGKYRDVVEVPYLFQIRGMGKSKLNARQQIDYLKHILSLMRRSGEMTRFIKFMSVGVSGIFVNEGLLWLLVAFSGLQPRLASPFAIEASIISNFLLNNFFTFSDRRSSRLGKTISSLLKFNLVSLIGLSVNWSVLWLFTDIVGMHYLVANLFGIAAAALLNYVLSNRWAWDIRKRELSGGS